MANKTLVLYFPVNQHIELLAKTAQEKIGADIGEVHPVEAYPDNYNVLVTMVKEQIEKHEIPEAKALGHELEDYDTTLVDTSGWWSHIAPPPLGLVRADKVGGKKVGTSAAHIGGGVGGIEETVEKEWPDNDYLEFLETYGDGGFNRGKLIDEWLEKVSLK